MRIYKSDDGKRVVINLPESDRSTHFVDTGNERRCAYTELTPNQVRMLIGKLVMLYAEITSNEEVDDA